MSHDTRRHGDQYHCHKCGKQWDVDDEDVPPCMDTLADIRGGERVIQDLTKRLLVRKWEWLRARGWTVEKDDIPLMSKPGIGVFAFEDEAIEAQLRVES